MGEGIEEVIGGTRDDVIRGNSNNNTLRGGLGNDILDGKSGDDLLDGGPGNDNLNGGEGNEVFGDTINESGNTNFILTNTSLTRGTGEVDVLDNLEVANLTGGSGNNSFTLTGWTEGGTISGGGGLDTVIVAADADFTLTNVSLAATTGLSVTLVSIENAVLTGGASGNMMNASAFAGSVTLNGNEGADVLTGGAGNDVLNGGLGNDMLTGGRGNDILIGGTGSDTLSETLAGASWDVDFVIQNNLLVTIQKDPLPLPTDETITETDFLSGIETANLTGSPQNDTFDATGWTVGSITVNGAGGDDIVRVQVPVPALPPPAGGTVTVTDAGITFTGSAGTITFNSIESAIVIGTGRDEILDASGFTGNTWLQGMGGNDVLRSGRGSVIQILEGGDGDDRFEFSQNLLLENTWLLGGEGTDTLDFSAFTSGVAVDLSNIGADQVVLVGELTLQLFGEDVEIVIGGSGADTLTGNSLDNTFTGGGGIDNINGGTGVDTIVETADANFTLTNTNLTIGGVTDTLASIERATLTGGAGANTIDAQAFTGRTTLSGVGGNDILIGGSNSDTLIGGAGNDTLRGNAGSDTYQFDADELLGDDIVDEVLALANGSDTLDFSLTTTVGITINLQQTTQQVVHVTNLRLTLADATGIENVTGGDQGDSITGNATDNIFIGGLGHDTFVGNGGTLDTVFETRDADFLAIDTSLTITDAIGGIETDTLTGIQRVVLIGGGSNNVMDATAFTGAAWLRGMEGNDALYGGSGDDLLLGDEGEDTLRGNGGDDELTGGLDNDTYVFDQSFDQGTDSIHEFAGGGYADTLLGVGVSGIGELNLNPANVGEATQMISDNLTLIFEVPSEIEFSF
jgi:Ca2+-binding RTX toxin-like protein